MEAEWRIAEDSGQRRCERGLFWAVIGLAEFHMFACSFREVLPGFGEPFFRLERWFGAAIFAALLVYLGYALVRRSDTPGRLKAMYRHLCSLEQAYMFWTFFWYIFIVAFWQLLRGGNLFRVHAWWIFETGLMAFVFFPLPRLLGWERAKIMIETMMKPILILHMLVWAWLLLQYFRLNYVTLPSGGSLSTEPGHLMSFGYNPNITGAGGLIMMALCLYFTAAQDAWRKLPYIFGAVVYFVVLVLTNCRTSWYCTLLITACGCFLAVWFGLKEKPWILRAALGLLLAVGCVLILLWLRGELFTLLDACHSRIQGAASAAGGGMAAETGPAADYMRTAGGEDAGDLTGRMPLYKACKDVMLSRKLIFFFGVPSLDIGSAVFGRYDIDFAYLHAHNFLLTTGMTYGVPTMIFAAVFLVSVFVRCFRVLFIHKKTLFRGFWMIPVILAALVAEDMMESYLCVSAWSMTCITFYLFSGWIVAMDKENKMQN